MGKLEWALHWAARGHRVFPLVPNDNSPAIYDNLNRATTDPEQIRQWWSHNPDYNIGAVPNGQVVVDLDEKEGRQGILHGQQLG